VDWPRCSNECSTSQYFGMIYYGAAVWLNSHLDSVSWKRLYSAHYRALRAAVGDYRGKLPKVVLDIITKRATPKRWAYNTTTSMAIKLFNSNETRLGEALRSQCYINGRRPRKGFFFDRYKRKIGRQSFANRLHALVLEHKFWLYWDNKWWQHQKNLKKVIFPLLISLNKLLNCFDLKEFLISVKYFFSKFPPFWPKSFFKAISIDTVFLTMYWPQKITLDFQQDIHASIWKYVCPPHGF